MQLIHIGVQIFHLLVIAVAASAPLVCIVLNAKQLNRKERADRDALWLIGTKLSRHANYALLLGSLLGLLVAGIVWSEEFHQRCHVLQDRIVYAGLEWLFSWILLLLTHRWWMKRPDGLVACIFRSIIIVLATTNLLYHFPILFMVINELPLSLVQQLESTGVQLSRTQFYEYAFSGSMLTRWIHVLVSMQMIALAYTAVVCLRHARGASESFRYAAIRTVNWVARCILILLFAQIGLGVMTVMSMPDIKVIMGGNGLVTALFGGAMCLLLIQFQQWTALLSAKIEPQSFARAITTLLALFSCMTAVSILS